MVAYSFKRRFVDPIKAGLGLDFETIGAITSPKRQTIRAVGKRRHARAGDTLQLYHGMRSRDCFKIGEARCVSVTPVSMKIKQHTLFIAVDGFPIKSGHIHDFARADGFAHGEEMLAFWHDEHPGVADFDGVLIKWEPLA